MNMTLAGVDGELEGQHARHKRGQVHGEALQPRSNKSLAEI
jgi:hypothetical protein